MRSLLGLLTGALLFFAACDFDNDWTSAEIDPDKEIERDTLTNDPPSGENPADSTPTNDPPVEPNPAIDWCAKSLCWDTTLVVCRDSVMIANFTRYDDGWTGGDATYSIPLPGNRNLWLFGDTFLGQVRADRSRTSLRLINNCLVVQDGDQFITYARGSGSNAEAFLEPPNSNHWYWPGHGRADEDTLYLFMHAFGTTGGMWGFYRTGVDLYKLDPYTLEIFGGERIVEGEGISWGAHVMEDGDYAYIYGVISADLSKTLYAARTDLRFNEPWEYYSNGEWVSDESDATGLFSSVSEQFSIFKHDGTYYFLTQHNIFGQEIYLYKGNSPVGPWENGRTVYCTPETGGDIFTYNAYAHPQFMEDGSLLVSYNINSFDFLDLAEDAENYRPYFIRVWNWADE